LHSVERLTHTVKLDYEMLLFLYCAAPLARGIVDIGQSGGRLGSVRVSEQSSAFTEAIRKKLVRVWRGDTAGLAAGTDGVFHALWIDTRTGVPQVWTAGVTVGR
jgi:hypothetical protein